MLQKSMLLVLVLMLGNPSEGAEQPTQQADRGELLYSTYCVACHSTQLYWRDKKLATDWTTLMAEVNRWQKIAGPGWSEDDVTAVTHYLNRLHYSYPTSD